MKISKKIFLAAITAAAVAFVGCGAGGIGDEDIDTFTNMVWENLNEDNKVSLFVRYIDIETGNYETKIINKNA